jgi:hypothetical protein
MLLAIHLFLYLSSYQVTLSKHIKEKHSRPTYAFFEYFQPRIAFPEAFSMEFSERECFW